MAKQLTLTAADGKKYTLEFTRATVERMQRNGFVLDTDRLYMSAKDLISGAFKKHHPKAEWSEIEQVWKAQNKRDELLKVLAEMFYQPVRDLFEEEEDTDDENKNPTWEIVE